MQLLAGLAPAFEMVTTIISQKKSDTLIDAKELKKLGNQFRKAKGAYMKESMKLDKKIENAEGRAKEELEIMDDQLDEEWAVFRNKYLEVVNEV